MRNLEPRAESSLILHLSYEPENLLRYFPEVFADPTKRDLYRAMLVQYQEGREVNLIQAASDAGISLSYVTDLLCEEQGVLLPVAGRIAIEDWLSRECIMAWRRAQEEPNGLECLLALQKSVAEMDVRISHGTPKSDSHAEFVADLTTSDTHYPSGLGVIQDKTGGFVAGDYWLIAARPGVGKTSLACTLAHNVAAHGHRVTFWSYEMRARVVRRYIVARMLHRVSIARIKTGQIDPVDIADLTATSERLSCMPLTIEDAAGKDVSVLCDEIRRSSSVVHFIDHIGYVRADGKEQEMERLSHVTNRLQQTAKKSDKCIIALVQLNRNVEREKRAPGMSDLRGSGKLEEDADVICFLHEPGRDDNLAGGLDVVELHMIFDKLREGKAGLRSIMCDRRYAYMYDKSEPMPTMPIPF